MTKRNIRKGGGIARRETGSVVFLFLPYVFSFLVFRCVDFGLSSSPAPLFYTGLLLILFSGSSLYGPLCLAIASAFFGVCACALIFRLGLSPGSVWCDPAPYLFLLPLFAGLSASAYLGLERSGELRKGIASFHPSATRDCLLTSSAQAAIMAASFALSQFLFIYFN